MNNPSEDIETRRKRLLWRATHRGTREMDLVLGGYARAHLATMTAAELDEFERLSSLEDPQLMGWVVGRQPVPPEYASELTAKILSWRPEIY
jgi:antitoxin CptB